MCYTQETTNFGRQSPVTPQLTSTFNSTLKAWQQEEHLRTVACRRWSLAAQLRHSALLKRAKTLRILWFPRSEKCCSSNLKIQLHQLPSPALSKLIRLSKNTKMMCQSPADFTLDAPSLAPPLVRRKSRRKRSSGSKFSQLTVIVIHSLAQSLLSLSSTHAILLSWTRLQIQRSLQLQ